MSDSLNHWSRDELVSAYRLPAQGSEQTEQFLATPFGMARPSPYQGDPRLLPELVSCLASASGKLGRLSVSRLLATASGEHSLRRAGRVLILTDWETGPVCDTHNTFELFTILAGVAHWHQLTSRPGKPVLTAWQEHGQSRLQASLELTRHPDLSKRALRYWEELLETWQNCIREGLALLKTAAGSELDSCLILGVEGFADFVYLADRHRVHYNWVDRCRIGLPTADLTALLLACEGDLRVMENMLLSYTKVRNLSLAEQRLILAELWFPNQISLLDLQSPNLNILALRRLQAVLDRRMALISDLEEVLSLPAASQHSIQPDEEDEGKEVLTVAKSGPDSKPQSADVGREEVLPAMVEPQVEGLAVEEESREMEQAKRELEQLPEQAEPVMTVEAEAVAVLPEQSDVIVPAKKVIVWKPFPRPLNAPPEPPAVEAPPALPLGAAEEPAAEELETAEPETAETTVPPEVQ